MDFDSGLLKKSIQRLPEIRRRRIDMNKDMTELCTEAIGAVVPFVSAVTPIINVYGHYKERKFAKRAVLFLSTLSESDIPQHEIDVFIEELSKHTKESGYDTITGMIDKLDNENKAVILSNLVRFCAEGHYSKADFLRVANALERVPYSDLSKLTKYQDDYYEAGESEILLSSGLIRETVIDGGTSYGEGGSKFGLSKLGETLLHYGFCYMDCEYHGAEKRINIPVVTEKDIEDIFSKTISDQQ